MAPPLPRWQDAHPKSITTRNPSNCRLPNCSRSEQRRRAVSDAAQWVRKRRQSELMRELLPATAKGAEQHIFTATAAGSSVFCGICSKLIWGFHRNNQRCIECDYTAHKACQPFAPSCLGRQGSIARPEPPPLQPPGSPANLASVRLVRVCISSADGLVRRNLLVSVLCSRLPSFLHYYHRHRHHRSLKRHQPTPTAPTEVACAADTARANDANAACARTV